MNTNLKSQCLRNINIVLSYKHCNRRGISIWNPPHKHYNNTLNWPILANTFLSYLLLPTECTLSSSFILCEIKHQCSPLGGSAHGVKGVWTDKTVLWISQESIHPQPPSVNQSPAISIDRNGTKQVKTHSAIADNCARNH